MNIGMMSTYAAKCGIATYTKYLCEALDNLEVYTEVLAETPYPESAFDKDFKSSIPWRFDWNRNTFHNDVIKDAKEFDIVHIQHQFGLFPSDAINKHFLEKLKHPTITTMHDMVPPNPQTEGYMKTWFDNSDAIIVHTKDCYDLTKRWGVPDSKIVTIPHGTLLVNIPDKSETRKELGFAQDAEIILSWGFIWESKGVLELVQMLAEIVKTHPKAILVHAGGVHPIIQGSDYLKQILKQAVKLGLNPKQLHITQWVPEDMVPKWFAISDIIILNYARGSASASGAGHRAMAAHKPIVKTDDLCIREIPGYTVPVMSPTDMYQGILKVLESTNLQEDLVKQADKAALSMSWDNVAMQHKRLYESLI
jgi:glycosyltransferase involved in cell wall biosynthesis